MVYTAYHTLPYTLLTRTCTQHVHVQRCMHKGLKLCFENIVSVKIVKPELVKHIQHSWFKATALVAGPQQVAIVQSAERDMCIKDLNTLAKTF